MWLDEVARLARRVDAVLQRGRAECAGYCGGPRPMRQLIGNRRNAVAGFYADNEGLSRLSTLWSPH